MDISNHFDLCPRLLHNAYSKFANNNQRKGFAKDNMTRASDTKDRSYKLKYAGQVPNGNYLNTLYKRWLYNAHNSWAQHVL